MPEVKLYVFSLALPDAEKGMEYVSKIQEIVAANLNCRDDDGNILPALDPDRVIVYLTSFGGPDGLLLATDLVAVGEIIGFDYEDRMRNISDRLSAIRGVYSSCFRTTARQAVRWKTMMSLSGSRPPAKTAGSNLI